MPDLTPNLTLDHLRQQTQNYADLTSEKAEEAVAREYGFPSWPGLVREVERREILDNRDLEGLKRLLTEDPAQATSQMEHWCDHPAGASPLGYVAMLTYDTTRDFWRSVPGTGDLARALIEAGAKVDGDPGESETPLITASSYGSAEVARALIEAGADLEARSSDDSGGVPGGNALLHAAVFGMTEVVDILIAAGASVDSIEVAAATGDLRDFLSTAPLDSRIRALVMAASHERLEVIDQLVAAGTPVDAVDEAFGGHPLREAAAAGRDASVERLLAHGADPNLTDDRGRTPLDLARRNRSKYEDHARFDRIATLLEPITS